MNRFALDPAPRIRALPAQLLLGACALTAAQWAHAVQVQDLKALSAPGQPLRARLTLSDVAYADLPSLRVAIAAPDAYQALQAERPAELAKVRARLQRQTAHTVVVDLVTDSPVQGPTLDVLLDIEWASGRLSPRLQLTLNTPSPSAAGASAVTVVEGDTLSELMIKHRYGMGTMAQRLIATQRANPKAFIRDNVNLVRAGAQLRMPSRAEILAIEPGEAQRLIQLQMRAFDAYRRGLAGQARPAQTATQTDQGSVETAVNGQADAPAGDRLTLSNGSVASAEQLAAQKTLASEQARQGELAANIQDLRQLAASLTQDGKVLPSGASASTAASLAADGGANGAAGTSGQTNGVGQAADGAATGASTATRGRSGNQAGGAQAGHTNGAVNGATDDATSSTTPGANPANLGDGNGSGNGDASRTSGSSVSLAGTDGDNKPTEPQWIQHMRTQPWLLPLVGLLLILLALWVWLRRSDKDKQSPADPATQETQAASEAAPVPAAAPEPAPNEPSADAGPEPEPSPNSAPPVQSLSALLPGVDLDLPDLPDLDETAPAQDGPDRDASLLEQAKSKMRNGDLEGARALAEEALTSPDPLIQDNAKAFLERL